MYSEKRFAIYKTKDIYLGYVTTINPDSCTLEGQFEKDILVFHKTENEKRNTIFLPLGGTKKYYTIEKMVPIQTKGKRTKFITINDINKIQISEKEKLYQKPFLVEDHPVVHSEKEKNIRQIEKELDVTKVKKLVA